MSYEITLSDVVFFSREKLFFNFYKKFIMIILKIINSIMVLQSSALFENGVELEQVL